MKLWQPLALVGISLKIVGLLEWLGCPDKKWGQHEDAVGRDQIGRFASVYSNELNVSSRSALGNMEGEPYTGADTEE